MKKALQIIASAAIALAALASCNKEQFKENTPAAGEAIQVSVNGLIGDFIPANATKATAESVVRVTWGSGDKVYVYDGSNASIGTLTVTPDDNNASYAMLSGTITASAASPSKLTLVYVKGAESAPDIAEGKISIPLSTQNQTEVPFVLCTTIDYDATKLAKENEYISFSFATSVMTVNCTGLQTGAEDAVTKAEIDGVSTICELSVTGDGVTVAGTTPGKITRTAGFQQSDQRASFSVALAKTAASETGRTIKVTKGSRSFTASYPKQAFDVSKSFNSVFALEAVPYSAIPFTITSTGSTTVAITKEGSPNTISLEYRTASADWTTYTVNKIIELADGEFVQFRAGEGGNEGFSYEDDFYYVSVEGGGEVSASGNIMSLLDSSLEETSLGDYVFYGLFYFCESLTDASNLVLPATTLANYCYIAMFLGCTGLTSAPALPATTLADGCYYLMFANSGLTTSPTLPATTLADYCYSDMFEECASLTAAPALPATTLAEGCYNSMFEGCTSLTAAPALPATTLAEDCYNSMFRGCTSLTDVPDFPAATLAEDCYCRMFYGCDNLTSAPALPAATLADYCYYEMFAYSGLTSAPALPAATLADYCYCEMFYYCDNLTAAPALPATTLASSCYSNMFYGCDNLTSAPALPATTLASCCYSYMFNGCAKLSSAPALPATTLASSCYSNMFNGCAKLSSAPALPATTLADYCYNCMFDGCAELSSAPELPATTLANFCYCQMFHNCDNLTAAPALPATTLANSCYSYMFYDCDNLTATPDLPATELVDGCYSRMFYDCHNLASVKALFLTTPGTNYTDDWLHGVASSGTFVKNASATWNVRGSDGIPTGWTVDG